MKKLILLAFLGVMILGDDAFQVSPDYGCHAYPHISDEFITFEGSGTMESAPWFANRRDMIFAPAITDTFSQPTMLLCETEIVYSDMRNGNLDIFWKDLYHLGYEVCLVGGSLHQHIRDFDTRYILYTESDGEERESLIAHNISSGVDDTISVPVWYNIFRAKICGNEIVFTCDSSGIMEVYLWNLETGSLRTILGGLGTPSRFDFREGIIVVQFYSDSDYDLYGCYVDSPDDIIVVANEDYREVYPAINDGMVVYAVRIEGDNNEIMITPFGETAAMRLTYHPYSDIFPKKCGDVIVFERNVLSHSSPQWRICVLYMANMDVIEGPIAQLETIKSDLVYQVGPNPFNNQIDIFVENFERFEVYDIGSREIAKGYQSTWSPNSKVPSGVYIFRIYLNNNIIITKNIEYHK